MFAGQFTVLVANGTYKEVLANFEQFNASEEDIAHFFRTMLYEIECAHAADITPDGFSKPGVLKSHLSGWLSKTCHFLSDRRSNVDSLQKSVNQLLSDNEKLAAENEQLEEEKIQLQSSTIQAQDSVIRLQDKLLKCKDDKLKGVSAVVEKAVQQSVKSEI